MGKKTTWLQAAAAVDECLRGPLPDVVLTQGRHLARHPDTPPQACRAAAIRRGSFCTDLARRLEELQFVQCLRTRKYGADVAEEWPASHTPPEVRADFEIRQHRSLADLEAATPPGDDDYDVDDDLDDDDDEDRDSGSRNDGVAGRCWWNSGIRSGPGLRRGLEREKEKEKNYKPSTAAPASAPPPQSPPPPPPPPPQQQLLTPPESHPEKHDAVPTPPSLVYTDSDAEDGGTDPSLRPSSRLPRLWSWSVPVRAQEQHQIIGRKRRCDAADLSDEDAGLPMRCGPRRSPYLRSGGAKYLKAI